MDNNLGSWIFFNLLTNLLWFFGLHGSNIVRFITNPIFTLLSLENLLVLEAEEVLPYIFTRMTFTKIYTSGGVGSMFRLAIIMVIFAKSEQFKVFGRLSLPITTFFINEPLLFGVPLEMNPLVSYY